MKKTIVIAMILLGTAVGAQPDPVHAKTLRVVTTTEDLAAITREIGGDRVEVKALCRGYQDPHYLDAKPSYMVQLQKADLYVQVGLDLEVAWAPGLLNGARNPHILAGGTGFVDASVGVEVIEIPTTVSRTQGDVHPYGNPHYWLDPRNGAPIARTIRDALIRASPADEAEFRDRCADFEKRLDDALTRWDARADALGLAGMQIVTYHRNWSYFASAYGLEVVDYVEPRPGIPPSSKHLQTLVDRMNAGDVKLLIMSEFFDPRLPQKISNSTGVPLIVLPTAVGSVSEIGNYVELFDHLFDEIAHALKGTDSP